MRATKKRDMASINTIFPGRRARALAMVIALLKKEIQPNNFVLV